MAPMSKVAKAGPGAADTAADLPFEAALQKLEAIVGKARDLLKEVETLVRKPGEAAKPKEAAKAKEPPPKPKEPAKPKEAAKPDQNELFPVEKAIIEQTKTTIDIQDDGTVVVGSSDEAAAKKATAGKRCFLVDYQVPTDPHVSECAKRYREGALGRLNIVKSFYDIFLMYHCGCE